MNWTRYRRANSGQWTGRVDDLHDPLAARVHQVVELGDLEAIPSATERSYALLGFACDEGVRRNMGRVGAVEGPWAIRKELAKFPANFLPEARLFDFGDIICDDGDLESAQDELSHAVEILLTHGYRPLVLGGGHEIVYGHYRGVRAACAAEPKTPLIINLDAHLDLRNFEAGGTSGTSFYQIASEHIAKKMNFDYVCLGTQTYGNTKRLYARAEELGVTVFDAKDITSGSREYVLKQVLHEVAQHESVYLTLDMDVLNAANAPGVSSPTPFGMDPEHFLFLVKGIVDSNKVRSIDIAEVSPRYDSDSQTAKLAAVILYSVMNRWGNA